MRRPRALVRLAVGVVCALVLTGCSSGESPGTQSGTTGSETGPASHAPVGQPAGAAGSGTAGTSVAEPVRVSIPAIGVDSALMRLGLNADKTVEVPPPDQGMTAGWYTGGAVPGEKGAAVVVGHNETRDGRGVFFDLKKVTKGAEVKIRDARGGTRVFKVTAVETVKKNAFPSQRVYGPTNGPELRLVTCDGAYDDQGHTVDNLIVYAEPET
ncbi:class F sortase [Streptomyces sp. NPDC006798]|uniref:class F sortase n=1 Tax=Streptomyces sp. NPDC006798 TaxID=3155462 RepID=UPI003401A354